MISTQKGIKGPASSFPIQNLTPSGLLSLDNSDGEVEILTRSSIELRSLSSISDSQWKDRDIDLQVTLTTHRIVFQFANAGNAYFCHLSNISKHSLTGGEWIQNRSYKILIETFSHGPFHCIFRKGKTDRDLFSQKLERALEREQWCESTLLHQNRQGNLGMTTTAAATTTTSSNEYATSSVGVQAIKEKIARKHERAKELTNQVFGDDDQDENINSKKNKKQREQEVETLMKEARELTFVIHKYVATLEKKQKKNSSQGGEGEEKDGTTELTSMLSNMGMITALDTSSMKSNSTTAYYETLARQVADFLSYQKSFATKLGGTGIITLTDLYCLFNRARGANMISPEDLMSSLEYMSSSSSGTKKNQLEALNLKLRTFDSSGIVVLQECNYNDEKMIVAKILSQIESNEQKTKDNKSHSFVGVTVIEAGRLLKLSPLLANEQLISAERKGYLCRDVTLEGIRFYKNIFVS